MLHCTDETQLTKTVVHSCTFGIIHFLKFTDLTKFIKKLFLSLAGDRAIKRLRVECDNHCNGCEFVGELGQHDATCDFSLLPCPNKCTDQHNKTTTVLRKDMEKHAMECPKRPYECPHCKETGDYQERTTKHLQECAKMEDVCPNEGCTEKPLRCDLPKHRQECPRQLVLCKYAYLGCDVTLPREEMTEHQKQQHHYELQHECKYILIEDIKYTVYKECTEFKDGSSLTIIFFKCAGRLERLDCTLHRPATPLWYSRTITLEMLNQLEDNNHFQHRFTLDNGHTKESISLPFLGHNSATNCQYLKNDKLYLRVSTCTPIASNRAIVSD